MKKQSRAVIGHVIMSPFMLGTILLSVFTGRQKAVRFVGRVLTAVARRFVGLAIPSIPAADQFDRFRGRVKRNYDIFGVLYDITVTKDTADTVQFKIHNCPFCETLRKYGFTDLSRYACAGDWIIAKENKDKWLFERQQTIGTGGSFCNPTYRRKTE
jgi:hypothetical protein